MDNRLNPEPVNGTAPLNPGHPSSTAFSDLQSNGYQVDQDVEPIERALLGSVLGIYCIPTVIDIIATVNSV
jgi:hypothetical protein